MNEIVIIYWTDASMHGSSQMSREDAKDCRLIKGIVAGHLVHEDKEQITVALDYFPRDDQFRSERGNLPGHETIRGDNISEILLQGEILRRECNPLLSALDTSSRN